MGQVSTTTPTFVMMDIVSFRQLLQGTPTVSPSLSSRPIPYLLLKLLTKSRIKLALSSYHIVETCALSNTQACKRSQVQSRQPDHFKAAAAPNRGSDNIQTPNARITLKHLYPQIRG